MNLVWKSGRVFQASMVVLMLLAGSLIASAYQKKAPSAPKPAAPHAASKPAAKPSTSHATTGSRPSTTTGPGAREAWDDIRSEAGHEPARNWEHE